MLSISCGPVRDLKRFLTLDNQATSMKCPVCGSDCVESASEILASIPSVFLPCGKCRGRILDKRLPLPSLEYEEPCACGKRFIDEVFSHLYVIMVEDGDLMRSAPLIDVGSPLVHPGFAMDQPPFLPKDSLVLVSSRVTKNTAERMLREVPEVRGVVRRGDFVPGITGPDLTVPPRIYDLLAGCDVRADIFPLRTARLVMYKQQSLIHIEFPRPGYPKIRSVEKHIGVPPANFFIDACAGIGTLGLAAACLGVPRVVMNDAWYASAFWSACNLEVNKEYLRVDGVRIYGRLEDMAYRPVGTGPVKIADTEGEQDVEVFHGDFRQLPSVLPPGTTAVTALDLFDKRDTGAINRAKSEWLLKVGGDVFVP